MDPSNETIRVFPPQAPTKTKIVSDEDFQLYQWVVYVGVLSVVTAFGMVANLLNMIVFTRMGLLTDSSNVSLLGLAITDFGGVSSMFVMCMLTMVDLLDIPDLSWDPVSLLYVAAGWPHVIFVQMTCWITAYIAFERCMCVRFPFKVKSWFSPTRTAVVICCVIFYFIVSYLPVFLTRQLHWRRDPYDNITRLVMIFGPNFKLFEDIANYVNIFISSTGSMIIVMVCTKLTISGVESSSKFRANVSSAGPGTDGATKNSKNNKNSSSNTVSSDETMTLSSIKHKHDNSKSNNHQTTTNTNKNSNSNSNSAATTNNSNNTKERKLVKMISIICLVFIVCNIPGVAIPYVRQFLPDIDHMRPYHNLCYVIYGGSFVLESINSSVNIFIYFNISTRYRQEFSRLFGLREIP